MIYCGPHLHKIADHLAPIYTKLRTSGYIDETGDQVAEMLRIIGVESLVQFVNIDLFKQINCLMVAMNIWFELCIQLEWCLRWKLEGGMWDVRTLLHMENYSGGGISRWN
jgi:hypothetical protein